MKTLKKLLSSSKPTLAVFMRIGGQNASIVKYEVDELKKKFSDKVEFLKVDASFDRNITETYKIEKYPTWVLFDGKKESWRAEGPRPVETIAEAIAKI